MTLVALVTAILLSLALVLAATLLLAESRAVDEHFWKFSVGKITKTAKAKSAKEASRAQAEAQAEAQAAREEAARQAQLEEINATIRSDNTLYQQMADASVMESSDKVKLDLLPLAGSNEPYLEMRKKVLIHAQLWRKLLMYINEKKKQFDESNSGKTLVLKDKYAAGQFDY